MFRNYLKISWRYLKKNKLYAFVNIFGLAIGITSCILIGLYIWHELSFDRFHEKADRIARVTWEYNFENKANGVSLTGTKVGPEFKRNFPEIEAYVRTMKYPRVVGYGEKLFDEKKFFYADSAFFSVFSFPLLSGDPAHVLDAPEKIVITQEMQKKYFGNAEGVGQSLKVGVKNFLITGVCKSPPSNSQIQFDFVGSFTSLNAAKFEKWSEANYVTYFLLNDQNSFPRLQAKIDQYTNTTLQKELGLKPGSYSHYHLEPLRSVHLHSSLDGFEPNGNLVYVYVLAAIAVLIMLIACVNYTNLSTAQFAGRSGEVGIRKVLGAASRQVFAQFMSESFLLTLFSVITGLGLAILLLPYFNRLSGKQFESSVFINPFLIFGLLVLGAIVALAAGIYPSLVLAKSKLTGMLRSGFRLTGSNGLRRSLIVFQFIISIFLIVSTIIILQQISYIRNKDLGYDKEQVVVLPVDNTMLQHYDDLKAALAANSNIRSIGGAYEEPTDIGWSDGLSKGSEWKEENSIFVNALPVDQDFVKTMNLKIIAGSDFNQTDVLQFDTSNNGANLHYSYILNESAARAFGWNPQQAVGQTVTKSTSGQVKAVVKDFHFRSFHEPIGPLVIFMDKRLVGSLFVKIAGNVPAALSFLENTWKQRVTHRPFEYHFLDEDYDALYKAEQRTAGVFSSFSVIAIILACLGLFALTAYAMVQRTKEIGIRKILGASVSNILGLVSKDFIRLVFIAFLIAAPVAWLASSKWLGNFVYRIPVHWWVFVVAGLATLIISFFTISLQAIKTALSNPVKNLRTE